MNKPVPPSVIPVVPVREAAPPRHDASHRAASIQLNVRFYAAMKPRRVYPLTVELPRGAAGGHPAGHVAPLTVKPVVPGAEVTPATQALPMNPAGATVRFQVAPFARGRLCDARVEVYKEGYLVDKINMSMRARTQRFTWFLLLLTILVSGLLYYYTVVSPLKGEVPYPSALDTGAAKEVQKKIEEEEAKEPKRPKAPIAPHRPEDDFIPTRPAGPGAPGGGQDGPGPNGAGGPPGPPGPGRPGPGMQPPPLPAVPHTQIKMASGTPGEVLQYKITRCLRDNFPEASVNVFGWHVPPQGWINPPLPDSYVVQSPLKADNSVRDGTDATEWIAWGVGKAYDLLCTGKKELTPAFWCAMLFLGMTLISMVGKRTRRAKVRKRGIAVPTEAGQPRPVSHREEAPTVVEPAE
jgi:hypothetical protein